MLDQEIEDLLTRCIDKCLKMPGCYYRLLFDDPCNADGFSGFWKRETGWFSEPDVDPFTCVLIIEQPERTSNYDDNEAISSLVAMFDRRSGWIRSFQCGYYGETNAYTSITGYLLGRKFRAVYLNVSIV